MAVRMIVEQPIPEPHDPITIRQRGSQVILAQLFVVLVLLFFFTIPTALVFVPGLLIWNTEGRKQFIAPLWELVGELMTPIALPEVSTDRPFRGHALPSGRE